MGTRGQSTREGEEIARIMCHCGTKLNLNSIWAFKEIKKERKDYLEAQCT